MANDYDNHERIWLDPVKPVDPIEGRQWCRDNVWGNGVEYVRADLVPAPQEHVEGAECQYAQDQGMPERHCAVRCVYEEKGFAAGIEQAARVAERYDETDTLSAPKAIASAIRALANEKEG